MKKGFESINIHGCANAVVPVPAIGENGNWFIGNDDTGISVQGPKGDKGDIPELAANLITTEAGKALDATMGTELNNKITELSKIIFKNKVKQVVVKSFGVTNLKSNSSRVMTIDISEFGFKNVPIAIVSGTRYFTGDVETISKDSVNILICATVEIYNSSGNITFLELDN